MHHSPWDLFHSWYLQWSTLLSISLFWLSLIFSYTCTCLKTSPMPWLLLRATRMHLFPLFYSEQVGHFMELSCLVLYFVFGPMVVQLTFPLFMELNILLASFVTLHFLVVFWQRKLFWFPVLILGSLDSSFLRSSINFLYAGMPQSDPIFLAMNQLPSFSGAVFTYSICWVPVGFVFALKFFFVCTNAYQGNCHRLFFPLHSRTPDIPSIPFSTVPPKLLLWFTGMTRFLICRFLTYGMFSWHSGHWLFLGTCTSFVCHHGCCLLTLP